MKIVCRLCLVLAAAWCIRAALVPVWIGRFRSPLHAGATGWVQAGVFALKDGRGVRASAPLWDPPPPHAENIPATARWPWQAVTRCEHVEIDPSALVRDWVCALITLGAVLAGQVRARPAYPSWLRHRVLVFDADVGCRVARVARLGARHPWLCPDRDLRCQRLHRRRGRGRGGRRGSASASLRDGCPAGGHPPRVGGPASRRLCAECDLLMHSLCARARS